MPFKRNNAFSGGEKKFGGGGFKPRGFGGGRDAGYGSRDFSRPQMHETTCAACGKRCEVPFKPNGRKPTFCGDCFRKEGGGRDMDESRGFGRPKYAEKRPYEAPNQGNGLAEKKLDEMNMKLDRILRELETMKEQAE